MKFQKGQFDHLIPSASEWVYNQESYILSWGIPLTEQQLKDARCIPVNYPKKVRILNINQIPAPKDPELKIATQTLGMITPDTVGLALRYGIYIRNDHQYNREVIIHELVHTAQYERAGSLDQFLKQYISDYIKYDYIGSPLEKEATRISMSIIENSAI